LLAFVIQMPNGLVIWHSYQGTGRRGRLYVQCTILGRLGLATFQTALLKQNHSCSTS